MNERFLYAPSIGFCFAVAWLCLDVLPNKWKSHGRNVGFGILGILLVGYGLKSIERLPVWKSDYTLNRAASKVSVNSARANNFMGYSLYQQALEEPDLAKKVPLLAEAEYFMDRALAIHPDYGDALMIKAGVLGETYQMDNNLDTLLAGFYEIVEVNPIVFVDNYLQYLNPRADATKMVAFYHKAGYNLFFGERNDPSMAVKFLDYGLEVSPGNGQILFDLTHVYYSVGNCNKVLEYGIPFVQGNPNVAQGNLYVGKCLEATGSLDGQAYLDRAYTLKPELAN